MTGREICEHIVKSGIVPGKTAEEIWHYSPRGELSLVFELYEQACAALGCFADGRPYRPIIEIEPDGTYIRQGDRPMTPVPVETRWLSIWREPSAITGQHFACWADEWGDPDARFTAVAWVSGPMQYDEAVRGLLTKQGRGRHQYRLVVLKSHHAKFRLMQVELRPSAEDFAVATLTGPIVAPFVCQECGGKGFVELLLSRVDCSRGCKPPAVT